MADNGERQRDVRYEANDRPQHALAAALGQRIGWEAGSINRLQLAAEEAIVVMLDKSDAAAPVRQLRLEAREEEGAIELDVVVAPRGANLEDALPLAMLGTAPPEDVLPFRILASIVDDFRHQQFHGIDFVTLRVRGRTC